MIMLLDIALSWLLSIKMVKYSKFLQMMKLCKYIAYIESCSYISFSLVVYICFSGKCDINKISSKFSALHTAVYFSHPNNVKLLVDKGAGMHCRASGFF